MTITAPFAGMSAGRALARWRIARWPLIGVWLARWYRARARLQAVQYAWLGGVEPRSIVMAVLFAGALLLAWLILPGEAERIAALERDGRGHEALALLEREFATGDRNQRTLFQMQQYYETYGELDKARRMLEMLAEMRPRDPQVHRRLAQFYKNTQDIDAEIGALRRQLELRYAEPACKELIGLLRQRGSFDAEQTAIQSCRQQGYRRDDDMIRLASLLAVDGDLTQAVALWRSADDLRRLKAEPDRLRLFGTLLMLDQPREAVRRAVRWARAARNDAFVDLLVDQLVIAHRDDTALDLVRAVATVGDRVSLTAAELMLDRDQGEAARAYLHDWLSKARLRTAATAGRFVRLAIDAGDPVEALAGAQRVGLDRLPQSDVSALFEALSQAGKSTEAELVRPFLRGGVLARPGYTRGPGRRGNRAATGPTPDDATRELESWRIALWTRLLAQPGPPVPTSVEIQPISRTRFVSRSRLTSRFVRRLRRLHSSSNRSQRARTGNGGTGKGLSTPFGTLFGAPK